MRENVVKDIAAAYLIDEDDRIVVFDVFLPVTVPMAGRHTVRELQRTRHMEGKVLQPLLRARQILTVDASRCHFRIMRQPFLWRPKRPAEDKNPMIFNRIQGRYFLFEE